MDACITTTPKKTHFYLLFSWKTNPNLRKKSERETSERVIVFLCEFREVICWREGVVTFVTWQGWLDVASSSFCVRVKFCSQ